MKKMIFTLVLAIASSVWMTNEAGNWCMPSVRTLTEPWIEVSGTFQAEGFPCEPDEVCPPCLTIVLVTRDKTYYLVTDDGQLIEQLDTIPLGTRATVSGIPFSQGSYDYIQVSHIEKDLKLLSLCDEWNVWHESFESFGPISFDKVVKYQLTTDTLINGQQYVKLTSDKDSPYLGAMREGNNRDIYYVPAGSTNEFLLYAFNAQVGEVLNNLYLGGFEENGYSGRVEAISDGSPRLFTIRVLYPTGMGVEPGESFSVTWIEGVGSPETPYGLAVVPTVPADVGIYTLLCAYKNGQQVYVSEAGEKYGCEYNYDGTLLRTMFPSDTRWHYVLNILTGEPEPIIKYYSIEPIDTLINNTRYQKIQNALFRSSGAKVWCALDSAGTLVERLVYDFDLQVGDSISITVGNENGIWLVPEKDPTYAKVTNVEYIKLADGRMARRLSYDYRSDDIEHIGSVKGILAPLSYPGHPDSWSLLLCCTRSDFLLYEAKSGACDTFLVNVQHTDTIPLYARDDSGSSTVDPVDPNQIYATLMGNVLTVHNNTGAQVTFTVNNISVKNVAARVRSNVEPVSFTDSVSIELSEDGTYEILLTSEEWNYTVFGTVNYIRSGTEITKEETSSTSKKVLRGTQILIEREGKTYTLTGQEVK